MRRSTLGAEQGAAINGCDLAVVIASAYAEVFTGPLTPSQMLHKSLSGELGVPVEFVTDAQSLYEALKNPNSRAPLEEMLVFGTNYLKDLMRRGVISKCWWVHAHDMLADALTKGIITRTAILQACEAGHWLLKQSTLSMSLPSAFVDDKADMYADRLRDVLGIS